MELSNIKRYQFNRARSTSGPIVPISSNDVTNASTVVGVSVTNALNRLVSVGSKDTAYVETYGNDATAVLNQKANPFLTIDAALDALPATGGVIKIGFGSFVSPTMAKIKSNTKFIGSGRPVTNATIAFTGINNQVTTSAPTMLTGGTILTNTFKIPWSKNNVECSDFGVDVGSAWVAAGNAATDAFVAQSQTANTDGSGATVIPATTAMQGLKIDNIITLLPASTTLFHGFLIQGPYQPLVSNIVTWFGFAGCVFKTIGGQFTKIQNNGHDLYGTIVKSNDYSWAAYGTVDGVECRSVGAFDGSGFVVDGGDAPAPGVFMWKISNVISFRTKFGFRTERGVNGCTINNITAFGCNSYGIRVDALTVYCNFSNLLAAGCTTNGIWFNTGSGDELSNNLSDSIARGNGTGFLLQYVNCNNLLSVINTTGYNFGTGVTIGNFKGVGNTTNISGTANPQRFLNTPYRVNAIALVGGTITVADTDVNNTNTVILLTAKDNTNAGTLDYTIINGTSFTIRSSNALDTRAITYTLFKV